jgi:hypothetical protein
MKRIIQGLVLATLISTAQASPFPADGDADYSLPARSTYADRHAGDRDIGVGSPFPAGGESIGLPAKWTYADRHAGDRDMRVGSAFPADGDANYGLPARSTYADRFATDRAQHAGSASAQAAALSE